MCYVALITFMPLAPISVAQVGASMLVEHIELRKINMYPSE